MFCPKCGSILMPKTDKKKKKVMACSCGYVQKDGSEVTIKEELDKVKDIEVIENDSEEKLLPLTDEECPKCAHKKAYYYTVQTRASDEPETKFLICEKCKYKWRDYN